MFDKFSNSFSFLYTIYLFMYVCVCACGICCLLSLGPGIWTQVIRLGGGCFTHWAISLAHLFSLVIKSRCLLSSLSSFHSYLKTGAIDIHPNISIDKVFAREFNSLRDLYSHWEAMSRQRGSEMETAEEPQVLLRNQRNKAKKNIRRQRWRWARHSFFVTPPHPCLPSLVPPLWTSGLGFQQRCPASVISTVVSPEGWGFRTLPVLVII